MYTIALEIKFYNSTPLFRLKYFLPMKHMRTGMKSSMQVTSRPQLALCSHHASAEPKINSQTR